MRSLVFSTVLCIVACNVASAQSGSLNGSTALRHSSGRPANIAETSWLFQPAPRQKVFQVEDLVHVHVKQNWAYDNSTTNQRKKNIETEARLTYWFRIPGLFKLPTSSGGTLPEIGGEIDHKTQNQGSMRRKETLDFQITCRVVSVQDNGNLIIEGTSSSQVGEEGKVMYVGGIIRPEDIGPDNTVNGSRVSELTVREIPSGNVYDTVRRPWGTRLMEHWKPF